MCEWGFVIGLVHAKAMESCEKRSQEWLKSLRFHGFNLAL